MNNTTHRAFLRIGFDDILDDHIPTITLCLVKRTLKLLPRGNLVLLFYILSFIRLVLRSNQRGCHVYSENELSDSPVGDADPSGDEHCLGRTVSYTEKKDLRYTCLFHLPYEAAHYGIEEIAHFFFDSLFQLDATQYNAKQRNTLYTVFLVMVLNADFLFDTIARHLHEEPAHSSPPDPSSEQSVFASHLPSSTQYTILCNGSSRYYCCCFYSYHRYTFSSALTHPALTTPLPDSFRRDIDTSSTDEEREREEDVFIPVCFFVLSRIPSPFQLCRLLSPVVSVIGAGSASEVRELFSFLLQEVVQPPTACFDVVFSIDNEECVVSGPTPSDRTSNRFALPRPSHLVTGLRLLFEWLDAESIVSVLLLLLLEEKVLFVSNRAHLLPVWFSASLNARRFSSPFSTCCRTRGRTPSSLSFRTTFSPFSSIRRLLSSSAPPPPPSLPCATPFLPTWSSSSSPRRRPLPRSPSRSTPSDGFSTSSLSST